ncbi:663_t:CDS:2 [Ambispora leptoticha]|uniref:663_t:CDS:1 n=1 Tax=Ambispora leptoticha TaxID=144679 RepID=A0A9N8VVP8_9GLOM|nr:663_t:CDS:2 [Ambispora leptoticha]
MPYTRPVSTPTTPTTPFPKLSASSYSHGGDKNSSSPTWPLTKITFGSSKTKPPSSTTTLLDVFAANSQNLKSSTSPSPFSPPKSQPVDIQRKKALEEVKEIISTSPQFSTSPRRTKSSPESYRRLHIDLQAVLPPKIITSDLAVLRRKNGEVVKSSLKSKSEPTTPICPKFVHFDADLEHVRFFLEAEKPQAVSCDAITTAHSSKPVFVESICLSKDQRKLQGRVQVQNIAFQKTVVIRYTFDFWSSVSEVTASYSENAQDRKNQNFDVFVFSIDLIDNSRNPINGQTMYFAVRYNVDNRDLWDNNNASNYQVNFKRLTKQAPPRASRNSRPKSSWSSPNSTMVSGSLESDELARSPNASKSQTSPNAVLKTNRYDINQSLSAAMTKPQALAFNPRPTPSPSTMQHFNHHVLPYSLAYNSNDNFHAIFGNCVDGQPCTLDTSMSGDASKQINMTRNVEGSRPIAIPTSASKPVLGSSSYYDFVDRYCFYQGGSSPHTIYASSPPVMI